MADIPKPLYYIGDNVTIVCEGKLTQAIVVSAFYASGLWTYRLDIGTKVKRNVRENEIIEKLVNL